MDEQERREPDQYKCSHRNEVSFEVEDVLEGSSRHGKAQAGERATGENGFLNGRLAIFVIVTYISRVGLILDVPR